MRFEVDPLISEAVPAAPLVDVDGRRYAVLGLFLINLRPRELWRLTAAAYRAKRTRTDYVRRLLLDALDRPDLTGDSDR